MDFDPHRSDHSTRLCRGQHRLVLRSPSAASSQANDLDLSRRSLRGRDGHVFHRSASAIPSRRLSIRHPSDQLPCLSNAHLLHLRVPPAGPTAARARHPAALLLRQPTGLVHVEINMPAAIRLHPLRLRGRGASLRLLRSHLAGQATDTLRMHRGQELLSSLLHLSKRHLPEVDTHRLHDHPVDHHHRGQYAARPNGSACIETLALHHEQEAIGHANALRGQHSLHDSHLAGIDLSRHRAGDLRAQAGISIAMDSSTSAVLPLPFGEFPPVLREWHVLSARVSRVSQLGVPMPVLVRRPSTGEARRSTHGQIDPAAVETIEEIHAAVRAIVTDVFLVC